MPGGFADVEYWNARFTTDTQPFEWLQNPAALLPYIWESLSSTPEDDQSILHIGPGSSNLSLALRSLVSDPHCIHNVDYSQSAIELGRRSEEEAFRDRTQLTMKWTCGDLLDSQCIPTLSSDDLFHPFYSLIVDKSATDAVACGPDVTLQPSKFRTGSEDESGSGRISEACGEGKTHPVNLLALHMAVLAAPNAQWLCLSYSAERFLFLSGLPGWDCAVDALDPCRYWALERKIPMPSREVGVKAEDAAQTVHRPSITYWLYILRRTNDEIGLCGSE